jgi:hypothetical protein
MIHVAAGCDCDNVGMASELLERDGAVHSTTGVAVVVQPDELRHLKLGARAGAAAVLLDVRHYGKHVEHVALPRAHEHIVTLSRAAQKRHTSIQV